jgi:ATP-dependent Clp protease adaptor protein ClpS
LWYNFSVKFPPRRACSKTPTGKARTQTWTRAFNQAPARFSVRDFCFNGKEKAMTGQPHDAFDGELTENPSQDQRYEHATPHTPAATQTASPTRRQSNLKPGKLPPWKVVLHNDLLNTMGEVVDTIRSLTPLSEQAAVRRMLETHTRGRSMLLTTHRERAELYRLQFARRGLRVTIGPA